MGPMRIVKVRDVKTPKRSTKGSACFDFFIPNDVEWETKTINPHKRIKIPSGIHARVPEGFKLSACNKSGIANDRGLIFSAQVVDSDYTGEIHLCLINTSDEPVVIQRGEKIMQFSLDVISTQGIEVEQSLEKLYDGLVTERGVGGFGSTGKQ